MKIVGIFSAVFGGFFIFPKPIFAHAFGQLYNLPVPFWLYLYGAAAALVVSFLVIGYFFNRSISAFDYPRLFLFKISAKNPFEAILKAVSIFFFLLTTLAGILGIDSSRSNFNMTFFWLIFLLGFTYLCALTGNLWSIVNPWKILVELGENITGREARGIFNYAPKLGYWSALVIYFLLIYFELIGGTGPAKLSLLLVGYTFLNFIGVILIGKRNWFSYGEFFSVFFGLIAKVAPIEVISGKIYLRPPFVGLVRDRAKHFSLLVFILFMLSSTAFDGFSSTLPYLRFSYRLEAIFGSLFTQNSFLTFQVVKTLGLVFSPVVFLCIYLGFIALAKAFTASRQTVLGLAKKFAFTLIPIALVYNIAHYYTLLLTEGQNVIRLASDPFGYGWNLIGSANFTPNIGIVGANFVWHSQVIVILLGHVAAVFIAHLVALSIFPSHKKALISQFPMLLLMVIYTTFGLWILSQPLTTGV
ncbi:MAG: hypothetical protein WD988_00185 [Candidatus Curtissbacteria bacterium]